MPSPPQLQQRGAVTTIYMEAEDPSSTKEGNLTGHPPPGATGRPSASDLVYRLASAALQRLSTNETTFQINAVRPDEGGATVALPLASPPSPSSRFAVPPIHAAIKAPSKPPRGVAATPTAPSSSASSPLSPSYGGVRHAHLEKSAARQRGEEYSNEEEEDEDGEDDDEDDVAARVLLSLKKKDETIAHLNDLVSRLSEEKNGMMRLLEQQQQLQQVNASSSPLGSPIRLRSELVARECEIGQLRMQIQAAERQLQQCQPLAATVLPSEDRQRSSSPSTSTSSSPSASVSSHRGKMPDEGKVARRRVEQLEMQLAVLKAERQEDVATLQEHLEHLRHKLTQERKTAERRHRATLSSLETEMRRLSKDIDQQAKQLASMDDLKAKIAAAELREQQLLLHHGEQQRRWMLELEEQKEVVKRAMQQRSAEEQQQRACSAELHHGQQKLEQAREENARLRALLEEAEGTVADRSRELRQQKSAVAVLNLELQQMQHQVGREADRAAVLQQQLVEMEQMVSSKASELSELQEMRAKEVEELLEEQGSRQLAMLHQVEGCVRGGERVEAALLEAEALRRDTAAQLKQALEERDSYRERLRLTSLEMQQQLTEQQQLMAESTRVLHERLGESRRRLQQCEADRAAGQERLQAVDACCGRLQQELATTIGDRKALQARISEMEEQYNTQTQKLIEAKASLKAALQDHLSGAMTAAEAKVALHRVLKSSSGQRQVIKRHAELRMAEQQALNEICQLLKLHGASLKTRPAGGLHRRPPHQQTRRSSSPPEVRDTLYGAPREADGDPGNGGGSAAVSSSQSIAMSEVERLSNAVDDDLCHPASTTAMGGGESMQQSAERRAAIPTADTSSALQTLHALKAAVQQLLQANTDMSREIQTRRHSIRVLLAEKKGINQEMEELRAAMSQQQEMAKRHCTEAVKRARDEEQQREKEREESLTRSFEHRLCAATDSAREALLQTAVAHTTDVQKQLAAELLHFLRQLLPGVLRSGVNDIFHATRCRPAKSVGPHSSRSRSPGLSSSPLTADGGVAARVEPLRPEVQAEGDEIARAVLGLNGGWSDLVAAAESMAPAPDAPPPLPLWSWETCQIEEVAATLDGYLSAMMQQTTAAIIAAADARPPCDSPASAEELTASPPVEPCKQQVVQRLRHVNLMSSTVPLQSLNPTNSVAPLAELLATTVLYIMQQYAASCMGC